MTAHRITPTTIVALFVATAAALTARAILQRHLMNNGYETSFAADLSYLVVTPILAVLLFPIWKTEKFYIVAQFRRVDINWDVALRAIAIGVVLRMAWWSQLVAGTSFGFYRAPESTPATSFTVSFHCPTFWVLGLGFFAMALLVPLIEELFHRGYVQGSLRHHGLVASVLVSAIVFTVFHRQTSWPFVFVSAGVFGMQYWIAKSLWPSFISHATINALVQFDWRCMTGQWNPGANDIPAVIPGVIASCSLIACAITLRVFILRMAIGARDAPR